MKSNFPSVSEAKYLLAAVAPQDDNNIELRPTVWPATHYTNGQQSTWIRLSPLLHAEGLRPDREALEAAEDEGVAPLGLFGGELGVREAAEDGVDGDLAFDTGQGRAQTEVDAVAEG